jgi:Transmembrane secretion effector
VLATALDFKWVLFSASALGIASALTARRLSIDFSAEIDQEAHPLEQEERPLYLPESDDGPITIALEIEVAPENHIQFFRLVKEVRLVFRRNGAFSARLDQDMENPNRFRLQAILPSWGEHQRLGQRITRDEHALWSKLWTLHTGQALPTAKYYLGIQHWIPEESAVSRLRLVPPTSTDGRHAR